jgi:hypothetical protein
LAFHLQRRGALALMVGAMTIHNIQALAGRHQQS